MASDALQDTDILRKLARCITERHLGSPVLNLAPVARQGAVNIVYRITLPERCVIARLQVGAVTEHTKESWCITQARSVGVPGPEVFALGEADGIAYMIESCVPGDLALNSAIESRRFWHTIGRYAQIIHSITPGDFPGDTDIYGNRSQSFVPSWWKDHVTYNIDSICPDDQVRALSVYIATQADTIREIFSTLLTRTFRFGLCHGDLSPVNCLVAENGEVTLIDWGCARIHVTPHHDLIELLEEHFHPASDGAERLAAFLDGYGISQETYASMLTDLAALHLLSAFDTLRWAIEHRPNKVPDYAAHATKVWKQVLGGG